MKTMALSREITLTIDNYNITLDKEIKIYEYDAINLCFTIQEYGIVMRDGKAHNRVMPVVALKAYMLIETPQGVDSVEATNIVRNKVIFSLGNKYSQFVGVGKMQIILRDLDGCRITLPEFNYEVKQSINTGWDIPDVLIGEKDFVITDELGRPVETTKISEMDEVNEVTPQTYTVVINEDGNKKIKLDTIMESISETIEFDVEEIDRRIDEMIDVYDDEEIEVEFPSLHNDVERIKDEINEIGESLDTIISKQYNNILDYGAKCVDGVDDSGVILKASEKGGVIDFSYLTCFIDNNIVINNSNLTFINGNFTSLKKTNIHLNGNNITFKDCTFKNVSITFGDYLSNTVYKDILVKDCSFTTEFSNQHLLDMKCLNNSLVDNCKFTNLVGDRTGSGVRMHNDVHSTNKSEDMTVINSYFAGFYVGVYNWGTGARYRTVVENNTILNCETGIEMYHCYGNRVQHNKILNVGTGIWYDGGGIESDWITQPICSHNQIKKCSGVGIKAEEVVNGIISENVIHDCGMEGICMTSGSVNTILSNNNIKKCLIGIHFDPSQAPTQIQGSWNANIQITGNNITNCNLWGIRAKQLKRYSLISNNVINACNTNNVEHGYGIVISSGDICVISDNIISNEYFSQTTPGYTEGICVAFEVSDDGTTLGARANCSKLTIKGNHLSTISRHLLKIGVTGNSGADNSSGAIINNFAFGTGDVGIYGGTMFFYNSNIGFGAIDGYIANRNNLAMKINKSTSDELPPASMEHDGSIILKNSTSDKDETLYICVRKSNGQYTWKEMV